MSGNNELLTYRREVPEKVRQTIKRKILEASAHGYDEFITVSQYILAELLAGNISPGIAKEARALLELIMTAITAKQITKKGGQKPQRDIAKDLEKARKLAKAQRPSLELTDYGTQTELSVGLKVKERAT